MANETKSNATGSILYRVNYQYVAKNSALRAGALIIEAKTADEAKKIGAERASLLGQDNVRITTAKPF